MRIDLDRLKSELDGLKKGDRGKLIADYAKTYGCSKDTVYRALRRKFGATKVVERRKVIARELVETVMKVKLEGQEIGAITTGRRGERELATEDAIDICIERGVLKPGELTVSSANRIARQELGFRMRDPKVRVEAEWANQEHQIDFSRSKYFQLVDWDEDRGDYILQVSGRELHYKDEDNDKYRLWIVQLKDSYSRVRLVRGYGAKGESAQLGIEFLQWAYTREDDENPLRFIPDTLKSDNGAFMKYTETNNLLKVLEINPYRSKAYNKDSQGKVESGFSSLWRKFELKTAIKMGVGSQITLSEYNELAFDFLQKDMEKTHPVRRELTREMDYRISISERQQREVNEDFFMYAFRTIERVVKQTLTVSIDNVEWLCPSYAEGKKITIYKMLSGELRGELQEEKKRPFTLSRFEAKKLGDFSHRPHQTGRQKLKQDMKMEKQSYQQKSDDEEFEAIRQAVNNSIQQKPKAAWTEPVSEDFDNERDARIYVGKRLPNEVKWCDVEVLFVPLMSSRPIVKKSLDAMLEKVNNKIRELINN